MLTKYKLPPNCPVATALSELFTPPSIGDNRRSAGKLRTLIANKSGQLHMNNGTQQDTLSFFRYMIQQLKQEIQMTNSKELKEAMQIFAICEIVTTLVNNSRPYPNGTCYRCGDFPKKNRDTTNLIELDIPERFSKYDNVSLQELFTHKFAAETINWKCDNCCSHTNNCPIGQSWYTKNMVDGKDGGKCIYQKAQRTVELKNLQNVIFVYIKRYAFSTMQEKRTNKVQLPQEIKIGSFYYEPIGTVNHYGPTTNSGHYTAFVKRGNLWFQHNDTSITQSSLKEINECNGTYIIALKRIEHLPFLAASQVGCYFCYIF